MIAFQLPTLSFNPLTIEQVEELESILGAPVQRDHAPRQVHVGPVWTIVQMDNAEAVLAICPDFVRMAEFDRRNKSIGVVVYGAYAPDAHAAMEVRAFAPSVSVNEDPVCGSGNGAVAAFIRDAGQIPLFGSTYISTQGAVVGRAGKIFVVFEGNDVIRVGGQSVTCVNGSISL